MSHYDLIGSRRNRSGLFALEQVEHFDILYLPAPGKDKDAGPVAILAAERYCRDRGAMLIVDPPREWHTTADATNGVSDFGYASPNMVGYFPRAIERGGDNIARPVGGAIAGLLCRQDRTYGPWHCMDQQGLGLQRRFVPAAKISAQDAAVLRRKGLNVLVSGPAGKARLLGSVTMGRGSETDRIFSQLPMRRFCLQIIGTIARATRWAVFEPDDSSLATRIRGQILTYLDCLNDLGAFAEDRFLVRCDAGVSIRDDRAVRGITILLVFHPTGCDEPISLTLHLAASGCRVASTAFAPAAGSADT